MLCSRGVQQNIARIAELRPLTINISGSSSTSLCLALMLLFSSNIDDISEQFQSIP